MDHNDLSPILSETRNPIAKCVKQTRRPLMTTEDLKTLEYIQNSYEKRFELGSSHFIFI